MSLPESGVGFRCVVAGGLHVGNEEGECGGEDGGCMGCLLHHTSPLGACVGVATERLHALP